jgi:type IV pilus assembly protein PilM
VVSPPFHSFFNRFVNIPSGSSEDLQESIKDEARQHLPFAIEEVIWSYQKIERYYQPGEAIEVVFFAVKRDSIDEFMKLLSNSGLDINIIQFAPVALYNYIMTDYASLIGGKNFGILDIGANNTDLILVEGNKFWIRNLPIVGNDITKAIQQKLEIPFVEAERLKVAAISKESPEVGKIGGAIQNILKDLINEIHRSIAFYKSLAGGRSVNFDKIILMGNGSKTIYLEEFVPQRLQLTPFKLTGLTKINLSEGINKAEFYNKLPGLGVALGLGLQGLEQTYNRINFLPPEIIQLRMVSRRKPFIAAIPAILILIILLLHLLAKNTFYQLTQTNKQVNEVLDKNKDIETTYKKVSIVDEKIKLLGNLSNIGWQKNIWIEVLNSIDRLKVLNESDLAPLKGYIEINNKTDEQWVKKHELEKIWLLEMKMGRGVREDKSSVLISSGMVEEIINIEIICGIVARQKPDGEFDLVASQEFVQEQLVKPLSTDFKIAETFPLPLDIKPVSELKTNTEINETPFISENPKYYRFRVNLQIPILTK